MGNTKYSAGAVKHSFWFLEAKKMIALLNQGYSFEEIKTINKRENLFGAQSTARSVQIFNTVSLRLKGLNPAFYRLFENSDVTTQKVIILLSIMKADRLFFDFVYEVYREKLLLGHHQLDDRDLRVFFRGKQLNSKLVASWTEETVSRLSRSYKVYLMEASLTDRSVGVRSILKPVLDPELETCLRENRMEVYIDAITGVK